MEFSPKNAVLRDGTPCVLRSPRADDAESILSLLKQVMAETVYLSMYPDEISMTVEEERAFLEGVCADKQSLMLSAFVDGKPVANANLAPVAPGKSKYQHRAGFGISVLRSHWRRGLGGLLTRELLAQAACAGFGQVELEVDCENAAARALYESCGFRAYGVLERAFLLRDGTYHDECRMVCRLD